ncbi:MAG TPA: hypothetical protein VFO37_13840 [Chitinophagaceae bacterium]|nr:hypothetical protein [Chitinophagaceae bacterium]
MKKPFQILSTAITIILYSCGIQNAEIRGTIKNEVREISTNGSSLSNEPDFLLIGPDGQILFSAGPSDQKKEIQYRRPFASSASYTIDRSDLAKTMVRLHAPCGVN